MNVERGCDTPVVLRTVQPIVRCGASRSRAWKRAVVECSVRPKNESHTINSRIKCGYMNDFSHIQKNLKKDFSELPKIKIAVLGDSSTQFLAQTLRGVGFERGYDLVLWEADFNQVERQVFDPASDLYACAPEIVVIFQSSHTLLGKFNTQHPDLHSGFASREVEGITNLYSAIRAVTQAKVIIYNYTEIDDSVFGNYANKVERSFLFQLRKLNYELMVCSSTNADLHVCDISTIQNYTGKATLFRPSLYINSGMVLSLDVLPMVAAKTIDIIHAFRGGSKKCLIVDLDNTLWGGIIGDDGIENIQIGSLGIGKAYSEFQYWIKKLKHRGIIIAVCSKNTESIAKEPFEKHPDMVLRLDDIAVFIANWEHKAENIRRIQGILNIGFDSMVFVDDNPCERDAVRENIPSLCVPELPEDPAEYLEYLYQLNLFETVSLSEEDAERTQQYQTEAKRSILQRQFTNEDDFLKSLNMVSTVEPFNKFNTPRVAQLSQRSNQFNLRTIRYTNADIATIAQSNEHSTFAFSLADKYGDNGLICVVILRETGDRSLFVDTWLMSCRVLKRGMEHFVFDTIARFALQRGIAYLVGQYIPTDRNDIVKDHYSRLGFEESNGYWRFQLDHYTPKNSYISIKQ